MEVIDARFLEIGNVGFNPLEGSAEALGVGQHAQDVVPLVPGRVRDPLPVQLLQGVRAGIVHALAHADEVVEGVFIVVQFHVQPFGLIIVLFQPLLEFV